MQRVIGCVSLQEAADDDAEEAEAAMAAATLERAAVLGRSAPAASLPLLAGLIAERRAALLQHAGSGAPQPRCHLHTCCKWRCLTEVQGSTGKGSEEAEIVMTSAGGDPSVALEQLWWLTRMAGSLLADAGIGETPLPPVPIAAAAAAATAPDADPVARLSHELLGLLVLAMDPTARPAVSPRCSHDNHVGLSAVRMLSLLTGLSLLSGASACARGGGICCGASR